MNNLGVWLKLYFSKLPHVKLFEVFNSLNTKVTTIKKETSQLICSANQLTGF